MRMERKLAQIVEGHEVATAVASQRVPFVTHTGAMGRVELGMNMSACSRTRSRTARTNLPQIETRNRVNPAAIPCWVLIVRRE